MRYLTKKNPRNQEKERTKVEGKKRREQRTGQRAGRLPHTKQTNIPAFLSFPRALNLPDRGHGVRLSDRG